MSGRGEGTVTIRGLERRRLMFWLGPPLIWFSLFMILPYGIMLYYSFGSINYIDFHPGFSLANYAKLFTDDPYATILLRSLRVGIFTAILSTIIAYPLALFMVFHVRSQRAKSIMYLAVILPWWASYLIKAYAWRTILGSNGVLNTTLQSLGLIDEPLQIFLFNQFSVVLTLTYIFTPFAVLSIYAALERVPSNILQAGKDMGATDWELFRRVIFPISVPGIIAGATITFSLGFGDFIAATLVGGSQSVMIAGVVINLMGAAFNWPLGGAIGLVVVIFSSIMMALLHYFEHKTTVRL